MVSNFYFVNIIFSMDISFLDMDISSVKVLLGDAYITCASWSTEVIMHSFRNELGVKIIFAFFKRRFT